MGRTRVLVVEDSLTVRRRIVEILQSDPDLEVVGEAEDGKRGIELCQALRPDVITLDMMLPVMTGLAATEFIMAYCPTPILIVSASTNRGELFRTYEALAAGALDVLDKPMGDEVNEAWERKLVATVKLISRIKVITHLRMRLGPRSLAPAAVPLEPPLRRGAPQAIAIGASTGGPAAVVQVLRTLPKDFPLPILLVVHLGKLFSPAFAEWLDGQSPIRVAFAEDGERLPPPGKGRVLLAPADRHLVLQQGRLHLNDEPELHSCRPAVDALFASVAKDLGSGCAACLLTGMGRDGAAGLLAIRRAGGATIAQDEETSVVFGMPREAIQLGAAEQILALDRIGPAIGRLATPGATAAGALR